MTCSTCKHVRSDKSVWRRVTQFITVSSPTAARTYSDTPDPALTISFIKVWLNHVKDLGNKSEETGSIIEINYCWCKLAQITLLESVHKAMCSTGERMRGKQWRQHRLSSKEFHFIFRFSMFAIRKPWNLHRWYVHRFSFSDFVVLHASDQF